jgi:hypothetical protein
MEIYGSALVFVVNYPSVREQDAGTGPAFNRYL